MPDEAGTRFDTDTDILTSHPRITCMKPRTSLVQGNSYHTYRVPVRSLLTLALPRGEGNAGCFSFAAW